MYRREISFWWVEPHLKYTADHSSVLWEYFLCSHLIFFNRCVHKRWFSKHAIVNMDVHSHKTRIKANIGVAKCKYQTNNMAFFMRGQYSTTSYLFPSIFLPHYVFILNSLHHRRTLCFSAGAGCYDLAVHI